MIAMLLVHVNSCSSKPNHLKSRASNILLLWGILAMKIYVHIVISKPWNLSIFPGINYHGRFHVGGFATHFPLQTVANMSSSPIPRSGHGSWTCFSMLLLVANISSSQTPLVPVQSHETCQCSPASTNMAVSNLNNLEYLSLRTLANISSSQTPLVPFQHLSTNVTKKHPL